MRQTSLLGSDLPRSAGAAFGSGHHPEAGAGYLVSNTLDFVTPLVAILALTSSPPMYREMARWQLHHRASLDPETVVATLPVGLLTLVAA